MGSTLIKGKAERVSETKCIYLRPCSSSDKWIVRRNAIRAPVNVDPRILPCRLAVVLTIAAGIHVYNQNFGTVADIIRCHHQWKYEAVRAECRSPLLWFKYG
jgi:hypothetical protein